MEAVLFKYFLSLHGPDDSISVSILVVRMIRWISWVNGFARIRLTFL